MFNHKSVEYQHQCAQDEFQRLAHQISHCNLLDTQTVIEREHFYVKEAEKIKEYRNGRKPQEMPVGDEQMIHHSDKRCQYNSYHGQFFHKFFFTVNKT